MYDLATGRFVKERRDVLMCSPPGTGKSHLVQGIGYQLIKLGYVVLYRSIFDVVRDFLHDEAMDGHDRVMARYLKPDVLIIDDFGMKQLPKRSGEFSVRDRHASLRNALDHHDHEQTPGRLGQSYWATSPRRRRSWIGSCTTPRSSPSPARATGYATRERKFKTGQSAHRLQEIQEWLKTGQSAHRLHGRKQEGIVLKPVISSKVAWFEAPISGRVSSAQ